MRFWLCLALTACAGSSSTESTPPAPPSVAPTATPPHPIAAAAPSSAAPVLAPAPAPARPAAGPLTAPHGSEITALAAVDDGSALVTADVRGGLRLWPALDGTREPVVVNAPVAKSVAVIRDGDGYAIAVLDAAGGVHVIRTRGDGVVRDRITVPGTAAVTQLEATSARLLALRADQTIDAIGPTGKVLARLPAEPGSHVDLIVARGPRALAIIVEDKRVHGRWIDLAAGAAWGAVTGAIDGQIASAALSPDGALLAINRPRAIHPQLFDLATGKLRATPLCVAKGWPRSDGFEMDEAELIREATAPNALGFVTNGVVACSVLSQLTWWSTAGETIQATGGGILMSNLPFAVSERGVAVAQNTNLGLSTVVSTRFLGYGLHSVTHVHPGPSGALITSDSATVAVGGDLDVRARFELSRGRNDWTAAVPLDDRYAVILRGKRSYRPESFTLGVFDGVAATERQALPYDVRDPELSYEPTTRLLATGDGGNAILLQLDPASHTFGPPIRIGDGSLAGKLRVVDPALADGIAAIKVDEAAGGVRVSEIAVRSIVAGQVAVPQRTYHLAGDLRAIDRAGRIYMREADHGDVQVYRHGTAGAVLRGAASLNLRPSSDGGLVAAVDSPRIALFDATGALKWDVQHWNNQEVGWLADGTLLAQFQTGVATVDLATGSLARRRCGWGFGISEQPFDQSASLASLCDARE